MTDLAIQNLSKIYQDGKAALTDFNWELSRGVFGLLGPNGAGKSTLLEILSLNLMPSSGRVFWQGKNIQKIPLMYRAALGYLPQNYGFYPELKALHILKYLGTLGGLHGNILKERMDEILEIVGLKAEAHRKVKGFSGGMRQRLAIAQALLHKPALLIVDEPTTGLDPAERVAFRNLLFELGQECIVLLSTHIVKDVEFSCHQMTLLYGGAQRFTGQPALFLERMKDRVFEVDVPFQQFEEFSRGHTVIAIREMATTISVRFILKNGDSPDLAGCRPVCPNLEDAYVDFIGERRTEEDLEEA